jgi:hypothetical protein
LSQTRSTLLPTSAKPRTLGLGGIGITFRAVGVGVGASVGEDVGVGVATIEGLVVGVAGALVFGVGDAKALIGL